MKGEGATSSCRPPAMARGADAAAGPLLRPFHPRLPSAPTLPCGEAPWGPAVEVGCVGPVGLRTLTFAQRWEGHPEFIQSLLHRIECFGTR